MVEHRYHVAIRVGEALFIMLLSASASAQKPSAEDVNKANNPSQEVETRIGTLEFTHDFDNGYPTEATVESRDIFFYAMLRPLGLEKGKPFKPDARQTKILTDAALVGEAMAKANSADRRFADGKYRSDAHWDFALRLDADDPDGFWNLLDERASWFYEAVGAGAAMAPKRPGPSSACLSAYKDKYGKWLDGGASYRLRVPPIKLFWSVSTWPLMSFTQ
jgi:hypothetical protein